MTKLTAAQVATYAARAGFTGPGLTNAVAVALAESGGDTAAVNVNTDKYRSTDRGLWQINSKWHPEVSAAQAFNPTSAAAAAFRISGGGKSWTQWATWNNGSAQVQIPRARLAVAQAGGSPTTAPAADPTFPVDPDNPDGKKYVDEPSLVDTLREMVVMQLKAAMWLGDKHNWTRVAYVVGGSIGVLIALKMLADSGAVGSTAAGASAKTGAAASLATDLLVTKGAGTAAKAAKGAKAAKAAA